jgi:transposase-like protein
MASKSKLPRRRWTDAFKKRVAVEAIQSSVSTAQVGRRYDLTANLVLNWKKKFGLGAALVPVEVVADGCDLPSPAQATSPCVEIDLPCGAKVRCGADVSTVQLAAIIAALRSKR